MEIAKWVVAIFVTLLALSIMGSVLVTILTISAILSGATIVGFILYALAGGIKTWMFPDKDP